MAGPPFFLLLRAALTALFRSLSLPSHVLLLYFPRCRTCLLASEAMATTADDDNHGPPAPLEDLRVPPQSPTTSGAAGSRTRTGLKPVTGKRPRVIEVVTPPPTTATAANDQPSTSPRAKKRASPTCLRRRRLTRVSGADGKGGAEAEAEALQQARPRRNVRFSLAPEPFALTFAPVEYDRTRQVVSFVPAEEWQELVRERDLNIPDENVGKTGRTELLAHLRQLYGSTQGFAAGPCSAPSSDERKWYDEDLETEVGEEGDCDHDHDEGEDGDEADDEDGLPAACGSMQTGVAPFLIQWHSGPSLNFSDQAGAAY